MGSSGLILSDWATCLGVKLSRNLKWNDHIRDLVAVIKTVTGRLYRLKKVGICRKLLIRIFKPLLLPYINYCISIWGASPDAILDPLRVCFNNGPELFSPSKGKLQLHFSFLNILIFLIFKVYTPTEFAACFSELFIFHLSLLFLHLSNLKLLFFLGMIGA